MSTSASGAGPMILAIDFGTQSVRALAYTRSGECRAKCQIAISDYRHPEPGWSEHEVEGFWTLLKESCQGLWRQGISPTEIAAVVVTTQRATVINLDEAGRPLRPAIVWTDQRRAPLRNRLPWYWRVLFTLLKIRPVVDNFEAEAEANWLERHQPDILARTAHYLLLSGYLNYRLTGEFRDAVGSQVGYLPFDFKKHDWCAPSDWKWHSVAVKRYMLPHLVAVGETLGEVTADAAEDTGLPAGVPVIAGAADKACEVLGVGALSPDIASVSCGTTATINTTRARYAEVVPFMPAYPAAIPAHFNTEIQIFRGFWMVSWFLEQFGALERQESVARQVAPEVLLEALLNETEPGAGGLVLQPFWNPVLGETGPEGRGSIVGFKDFHTRAHLYRALIEGLAFALRSGKERIEHRTKTPISRIRLSGGGAQSDQVAQIMADVLNLPVERFEDCEASGRGAAIMAAAALGWYPSMVAAGAAMVGKTRLTAPNARAVACYDSLYQTTYHPLYGRLKSLFAKQSSS
ncbi:MAG: FGGY-family carbohydrate kinase [Luminiphilus sp.]|nr:FGGY-family carbohydrate kinase [Luminiphilus sp.]